MKRLYLKPTIEIVTAEMAHCLCGASLDPKMTVTPTAEWGDEGEYAPPEWVNEKHTATYSWPSVGIEEDENDLASRAKGFAW